MATDTTLKAVYPVPESFRARALIKSRDEYQKMYDESIQDNDGFWAKMAEQQITWFKKWDKVQEWKYSKDEVKYSLKRCREMTQGLVNIWHAEARTEETKQLIRDIKRVTRRNFTPEKRSASCWRVFEGIHLSVISAGEKASNLSPIMPG